MLEKRRSHHGNATLHLVGVILTLTVIFFIWSRPDCPKPKVVNMPPGHLLLLPGIAAALPSPYPVYKLPTNDFSKLINLYNFTFLMNHDVCNESGPLVLTLVHSDPRNIEKRNCIRRTWGSVTNTNFKLMFLVGLPYDHEIQTNLIEENALHSDLIQGSFKDAYRNMTYKHVMALKWTTYFCPNAKYLLKTDDDVFVNSPALLDYIAKSLSAYGARRLILCDTYFYDQAQRSFRSKWRVSYSEYNTKYYPTYCHGWAVLYSPDVVFNLYAEAQISKYFWVDDVHITGIMASKKKYGHSSFDKLMLTESQMNDLIDNGKAPDSFLFGPADVSIDNIDKMWKRVMEISHSKRSLTTIS